MRFSIRSPFLPLLFAVIVVGAAIFLLRSEREKGGVAADAVGEESPRRLSGKTEMATGESEAAGRVFRRSVQEEGASAKPEEVLGDEVLLDVLRSTRKAGKEAEWKKFEEGLAILFQSTERIARLSEMLLGVGIAPEVREDIEWLVATTLNVWKAVLDSGKADAVREEFSALFRKILAECGVYVEGSGERVLRFFVSSQLLDESHLQILSALRANPTLAREACLAVMGIAGRARPPRTDLLEEFLDAEDPSLMAKAIRALSDLRPEEGVSRAISKLEKGGLPAEARRDLYSLVAVKGDPERTLRFLAGEVKQQNHGEKTDMLVALDTLSERDIGKIALELYVQEEEPRARELLLLAGAHNHDLLDLAVDMDENLGVRGQALMLLAANRVDKATGTRILASLSRCTDGSLPLSRRETANYATETIYAAENYLKASPTPASDPMRRELVRSLRQLAEDPATPEDLGTIAKRALHANGND